ncbi:hypothetical protein EDD36DRAFT_216116 [Exophiala viscosa]|uniref:N-acetyltransferase domain-containing protein n=1 Tax=Exophiala viscosa TaxID=2486360 RepID=A0AAN6DXW3_9EURO|nr:hypothetical protein EDD36DRAFT_216116 [Exophiala viscosa]
MALASLDNVVFEGYTGSDITTDMVKDAAALFSRTYGVWSPQAETKMGSFAKPGNRVRMSASRLHEECLPKDAESFHARARTGDQLVGHVFAVRWMSEGQQVCWVTQLCMDPKYRGHGLATRLLVLVRQSSVDAFYGILSSNPAAVLASLKAFGAGLEKTNLNVAKEHAKVIMQSSPIGYVKTATLRGSLFDENTTTGAICCADTNFWVDHKEPLEILEAVRQRGWPFGDLPDGHEFLALITRQA